MNDKGEGCGLLFTAPKECNDNEEFIHHAQIRHLKNPQVIDKKTKDLRFMNDSESEEYLDNLKKVMKIYQLQYKKKYPLNKISIVQLPDEELHHIHEIQIEPVFGTYSKETSDIEISRRTLPEPGAYMAIFKTITSHVITCNCGKEAYRTEFQSFYKKEIKENIKEKTRKKSQV